MSWRGLPRSPPGQTKALCALGTYAGWRSRARPTPRPKLRRSRSSFGPADGAPARDPLEARDRPHLGSPLHGHLH
eukprot:15445509-Alexandrium_andersonii.AAC.1